MLSLAQRRSIVRYRRLVMDLGVLSQCAAKPAFPPFVVFLHEDSDGKREWWVEGWTSCLRHEDCKDEAVATIRRMAKASAEQEEKTIAVWFVVTGWGALGDGTRPSKHPERKHALIVFESTLDGDTVFERFDDGDARWINAGTGTGRFEDLIGREKHVKHLRVVSATKEH